MSIEPDQTRVHVRPLHTEDVPRLLDLVDALADYERLPRPDAGARQRLAAAALATPPTFEVLLAEVDGDVVGYALHVATYSTFLARPTLYLEDLFVRPDARGHGAGDALFRACARTALERGCGRFEWQVLDWNRSAIAFYSRRGARQLGEWLTFRLEGAALQACADATNPEHPGP